MSNKDFTPTAVSGKQPKTNNRIERLKQAIANQADRLQVTDQLIERLHRLADELQQIAQEVQRGR